MTLETLVKENEFAFSVDAAKMLEKLKRFQTTDQLMYVTELVRIAVASKPSKIKIKSGRKFFSIEHDGVGMSEDELNKTLTEIFQTSDKLENLDVGDKVIFREKECTITRKGDGEFDLKRPDGNTWGEVPLDLLSLPLKTDSYRRLGTSIISALSSDPERIEIETTKNGKSITALIDEASKEIALYEGFIDKGTKISIIRKKGKFSKKIDEINRIKNDCRYSPVPIYLSSKQISRELSIENPIYQKEFSSEGIRGVLGLSRPQKKKKKKEVEETRFPEITFLKNGIEVCKKKDRSFYSDGLKAIIDSDNLDIIVSGNEIIENEKYQKVINNLKEETQKLAIEMIGEMNEFKEKDREQIRKYLLSYLGFNLDELKVFEIGYYSQQSRDKMKETPIANLQLFQTIEGEKVSLLDIYEAQGKGKLLKNKKPLRLEKEEEDEGYMVVLAEEGSFTEGIFSQLFPRIEYYSYILRSREVKREQERDEEKQKRQRDLEMRLLEKKDKRRKRKEFVGKALKTVFYPVYIGAKKVGEVSVDAVGRAADFVWFGTNDILNQIYKTKKHQENVEDNIINSQPVAYDNFSGNLEAIKEKKHYSLSDILTEERMEAIRNGTNAVKRYTKATGKFAVNAVWLPVKYSGLAVALGIGAIAAGVGAGGMYAGTKIGQGASFVGKKLSIVKEKVDGAMEKVDVGLDYGKIPLEIAKKKTGSIWQRMMEEFNQSKENWKEKRKEKEREKELTTQEEQRKILEQQQEFTNAIGQFFVKYLRGGITVHLDNGEGKKILELDKYSDGRNDARIVLDYNNQYVQMGFQDFIRNKNSLDFFVPLILGNKDVQSFLSAGGYYSWGDSWREADSHVKGIRSVIDSAYAKSHPFGLYHEDSKIFAKIFNSLSEKEQRDTLGYIFSLNPEERNLDSDKWVSENYPKLLEEVGMSLVGQDVKSRHGETKYITEKRVMYNPRAEDAKSHNYSYQRLAKKLYETPLPEDDLNKYYSKDPFDIKSYLPGGSDDYK